MNICFIACFNKTVFFQCIAKELERRINNLSVSWISTSPTWTKYLIDHGVNQNKITQIHKNEHISSQEESIAREALRESEKINGVSANFIIQSDRIISHWPQDQSEKYLLYCTHKIIEKIKNENIKLIFGEATALHETLTAFICKTRGAEFKKPHTIRIPSNYFAFFEGYLEDKIHEISHKINQSKFTAEELITDVTKNNKKPQYFYTNNKPHKIFDKKLIKSIPKKLLTTLSEQKTNAAEKSISHHLFIEKKYLASVRAKLLEKYIAFENPVHGEKNILFTLHKQPEASIDVLGTEHSNQIELIKKISIHVPSQYKIYVKEHSNAIGDRPLKYLKNIQKIPNVRLIHPNTDSHKLIKNSSLVITISGTIAYEAAIFGVKSATLSPMFFNTLPSCKQIQNPSAIPLLLSSPNNHSLSRVKSAIEEILKKAHPGIISDPISLPECISKENIETVSNAFELLINEKETSYNM